MPGAKPLRVAVWSSGGIGSIAINTLRHRADMKLVGLWAHSSAKLGKDAGELAGGKAMGVTATNDVASLIALKPDCVVYAASGPKRDAGAMPDYLRLLKAGINVVSTTSTRFIYPPTIAPEWRKELEEAAKAGKASFYASGIEPGFAADQLPLVLSTLSKSIRSIHAYEIGLYDDYPVADVMMDGMGFGRPMDFTPWVGVPGAVATEWAPHIHMIADALGYKVQEVRGNFEKKATARTLDVACGRLEAGTCGAIRTQAIGVIDGRPVITIEHVTRMARDVAPEWPTAGTDLTYRVKINGEPDVNCDLSCDLKNAAAAGVKGMVAGAGAMVGTAMRVVNAIPYVVAAQPGLLSSRDLPITIPHNVLLP